MAAAQPYLFPDTSALDSATDAEAIQELAQVFPFHIAVVNFMYFITNANYTHLAPPGMTAVVEEIYLGPLKKAQVQALTALENGAETELGRDKEAVKRELELLGERIAVVEHQIETVVNEQG